MKKQNRNTTDKFNKSLRSSLLHYVFTWQIVVSLHLMRLNVVYWTFNIVTQGFMKIFFHGLIDRIA